MPVSKTVTSRPKVEKKLTRCCKKCGKVKKLEVDFYSNRDWADQLGRDIWCKECVAKCFTKDEIREYFWENNREFTERIWEAAKTKAEKQAINNDVYKRSSEERRNALLERITCSMIPSVLATNYKFVDNQKSGAVSYQDAKEKGQIKEEKDPNIKTYSKEFNGYFKPDELEYLSEYYAGLEQDFDLSDVNLRDTAKKLAKASLQADKAQDDYMAGKCDFSVVKDALAQFDLLSKSGNFSACKRKPGENVGMGSYSELVAKLETNGYPCTRKIEWEEDDVDRTINEFRFFTEALQLDQQ